MTTKKGFTLAEVLLTLSIIGVVAAIVMPTLTLSINGAQYKAKFQKTVNSLAKAVAMNLMLDNYDFSQTVNTSTDSGVMSIYNIFKNRLEVAKIGGNDGWEATHGAFSAKFGTKASGNYTMFFNDGFVVSFPKSSTECTEKKPCKAVVDVNGKAKPNRMVFCDNNDDVNCKVTKGADIYPVLFYDDAVVPNSPAASASFFNKNNLKGKQNVSPNNENNNSVSTGG